LGIEHIEKETKMDEDTTSQLSIWHRSGFGRRVLTARPPYFVISPLAYGEDRDAVRRQALAGLAGL
jgi:hypothetical protein